MALLSEGVLNPFLLHNSEGEKDRGVVSSLVNLIRLKQSSECSQVMCVGKSNRSDSCKRGFTSGLSQKI